MFNKSSSINIKKAEKGRVIFLIFNPFLCRLFHKYSPTICTGIKLADSCRNGAEGGDASTSSIISMVEERWSLTLTTEIENLKRRKNV
jgi:hypothetical protein